MIPFKHILSGFLRGRVLIALILYALPFGVLIVLGTLWLAENGWLLPFVIATTAVIAAFRLVNWALQRRPKPLTDAPVGAKPVVEANPDWTDRELAVYRGLSVSIAIRLATPMDWSALQAYALDIVQVAANDLSQGRRKALDFSVPEALLLVNRVITRLRSDMRRHVPFVDTMSIATLLWLWSNRSTIQGAAAVGKHAWRAFRFVRNPVVGAAQEAQGMLLGQAGTTLQSTGMVMIQKLILEEVARAAIDLHSGHLRFSDAELRAVELASEHTDARNRPVDDVPLRVMVVGQASAGKTSLINALSREDRGETDMAPTTAGLASYDLELGGVSLTLVDTEGFEVSQPPSENLLAELMQADLILWAVRATRPARAPDLDLLTRLRASFSKEPMRRPPRIIVAATAVDRLLKGWPFPEHQLPAIARQTVAELTGVIARELGEEKVLAVSSEVPEWNIAELADLIVQQADDALAVQRNRRRIEAGDQGAGILAEAARAGQGAVQLGRMGWQRLWGK